MSCSANLYTLLGPNYTTGGTWYQGAPVNGDCGNIVIGLGENPSGLSVVNFSTGVFDSENAIDGTYKYTYVVGDDGCLTDCATVTITVAPKPVFLINSTRCTEVSPQVYSCTENFCTTNTTPINLYQRYFNNTGTSNPAITVASVSPTGFNVSGAVTAHTFTPSTATPGTSTIVYRRQVPGGNDCANCLAQLTINLGVNAQPNAGNDAAVTICT